MKNLKPQSLKTNKPNKLRLAIIALIACVVILAVSLINWQTVGDYFKSINFKPSSEITSLTGKINLTKKGQRILYATSPSVEGRDTFNQKCDRSDDEVYVLGCYWADQIFIFDVQNDDLNGIKEVTLAHELLHAAFGRLSFNEQKKLEPLLNEVYHQNDSLEERLSHYPEKDRYNELHSIIGTEIYDLPNDLWQHYSQYFSDRSNIVSMYESYEGQFSALKKRSDELASELDVLSEAINSEKQDYSDGWDELEIKIADFNRRADAGLFAGYSAFYAERSVLVAEQSRLDALYEKINTDVDKYNQLVEEYNEISIHLTDLNNSVDSEFFPKVEVEV